MKVELREHGGCFEVHMTAESLVEAAQLTRMGMNSTKEIRTLATYVSESGTFSLSCVVGKAKRASNEVPRLKRR